MPDQDVVELRWIFAVIRRWKWLILGCTIVAVAIVFLATSLLPSVYEATTTLLVQPAQDTKTSEYTALITAERLALTYSRMLKGRPVLDAVISQMGLEKTPEELVEKIKAEPIKDTQLIQLTVWDSSPEQATLLANTIAEAFIAHIQTIQTERFAGSLKSIQDYLNAVSSKIEETRSEIQYLSAKKITGEAELTRLETQLAEYRSDYREFQRNYQTLQLAIAQLTNNVSIVEAAHVPENRIQFNPIAVVTLFVDKFPEAGVSDYTAILASERSALTYANLLKGRPVLEAAIEKLGLDLSLDKLANQVNVEIIPDTQLIRLSVAETDSSRAILLADTIAGIFIDQMKTLQAAPYNDRLAGIQAQMDEVSVKIEDTQVDVDTITTETLRLETEIASLESQLTDYRNDYRVLHEDFEQLGFTAAQSADAVVVAEPAEVPVSPVRNRALYLALAALVSALAAIGLAFLLEYVTDVIRTPDDVSQRLGLATLGVIGHIDKGEWGLVVATKPRSPIAEAFRVLATNLRFSRLDEPLRTVLVTSPHSHEGKSVVVANLAAALAQRELRVVVVDADLRMPKLHQLFGLDQEEGLTGSLLEGSSDGNLKHIDIKELTVLTSGDLPPNPAEVVGSSQMRKLLDELVQKADLVLIDCPPILPVTDATILASMTDGVLLVLRAEQTRGQAAREAVDSLRKVGAHLIGVVLNAVPGHPSNYYRYYERGDGRAITGQLDRVNPSAFVGQIYRSYRNRGEQSERSMPPQQNWRNFINNAITATARLFKKQ